MEREIPLTGGRTTTGVVRVGHTIRRPIDGRGPLAHGLLHHLERRGFNGAPRFLGIDNAGREVLSFIPGFVPPELGYFTGTQLAAAARSYASFTTQCWIVPSGMDMKSCVTVSPVPAI